MTPENKPETLDKASLLTMAGEISRLLAAAVTAGYPSSSLQSAGPSGRTAVLLETVALGGVFRIPDGGSPASRRFGPEHIPALKAFLRRKSSALRAERDKTVRQLEILERKLVHVGERRAAALEQREAAQRRFGQLQAACRKMAAELHRREAEGLPHLQCLSEAIRRQGEVLAALEKMPPPRLLARLFRSGSHVSRRELLTRKQEYEKLRIKYELGSVSLERGRAGLDRKTAYLLKLAAELDRRAARVEILGHYRNTLQARLTVEKARLAAQSRESASCVQALADVEKAGEIWRSLKKRLLVWPASARDLQRQAGCVLEACNYDFTPSSEPLVDRISGKVRTRNDRLAELDRAASSAEKLLLDVAGFQTAARKLSTDLARAVAGPEPGPEKLPGFITRFKDLEQAARLLTERRNRLAGLFAGRLEAVRTLDRDRISLEKRRRWSLGRDVARVRKQAARVKAMGDKAARAKDEKTRLLHALIPLIGPDNTLRACALSAALKTDSLGKQLGAASLRLAALHDRLTASLGTCPAAGQALSSGPAEELLDRLNRLPELSEVVTSLKHRLADYRVVAAQRKRVLGLESARRRDQEAMEALRGDNSRLNEIVERGRRRAAAIHAQNKRLAAELEAAVNRGDELGVRIDNELQPLINGLGRALRQGRVKYADLLRKHGDMAAELALAAEALSRSKEESRLAAAGYSRALAVLGLEMARREQVHHSRLEDFKAEERNLRQTMSALTEQRDQAEKLHGEALKTISAQTLRLDFLKERLAELYPLLEFFLNQAGRWAGPPPEAQPPAPQPPQGSEYFVAMVHLLSQENENLKTSLGILREEKRVRSLEHEHLSRSNELLKRRLQTLLPIVDYFWQAWFKNTAELADVLGQRRELSLSLQGARRQARTLALALNGTKHDLAARSRELAETCAELEKTAGMRDSAEQRGDRLAAELAEAAALTDGLAAEKARLQTLASSLEDLNQSLGSELAQARSEIVRLGNQSAGHRKQAEEKAREAAVLRNELAEKLGRNEAAWAALGSLAERSAAEKQTLEDSLAVLEKTVAGLRSGLAEADARNAELEARQDRLGLLLWVIARHGGGNEEVWAALLKYTEDKGFRDAAEIVGRRLQQIGAAAAARLADEQFRRDARRSVQRGLYTLLLAGGLVAAVPQESSKATALPTLIEGPPHAAYQLKKLADLKPEPLAGPVYSPYVRRIFDLGALSPEERARGFEHLQNLIEEEIDARAGELGLSGHVYAEMIRQAYEPGRTIALSELDGERSPLRLLQSRFPAVCDAFRDKPVQQPQFKALYRLAQAAGPRECLFWDRLAADFRSLGADEKQSLDMVLHNIRQHQKMQGAAAPEFAGRLNPIPEVESMGLTRFTEVMAPYFRKNIEVFQAHARYAGTHAPETIDAYARRLAEDMYVAGRLFGVPLTFMVSIAHQETYFANVLGDHSRSASPFQIFEPTKPFIVKAMLQDGFRIPEDPARLQDHLTLATYMAASHMAALMRSHTMQRGGDRAPLCNLDRVALSYNGGDAYPGAVYRKKLRLAGYLKEKDNTQVQAKAAPKPQV